MQNVKKMHVKTGDTVMVRSGKYAKAVGKVIGVSPKEGKVIVEDVHMVHKHVKPRKQGEAGGIIETAGAIYACKVQLYCPKCQRRCSRSYEEVRLQEPDADSAAGKGRRQRRRRRREG